MSSLRLSNVEPLFSTSHCCYTVSSTWHLWLLPYILFFFFSFSFIFGVYDLWVFIMKCFGKELIIVQCQSLIMWWLTAWICLIERIDDFIFIITLDDVLLLLHLPITGALLRHPVLDREGCCMLLVDLLGETQAQAHTAMDETRGLHVHFSWLRDVYEWRIEEGA